MRIALAQIDARLGDIEGICARIGSQAALAHDQGADLLCVPAPLMTGLAPGSLTDNPNYEHALIAGLRDVARQLETLDMEAIVPAPVGFEHMPLIEVFLLRDGRVIPLRSVFAAARNGSGEELWLPPVFDVRGVRLAVPLTWSVTYRICPQGATWRSTSRRRRFRWTTRQRRGLPPWPTDTLPRPRAAAGYGWLTWRRWAGLTTLSLPEARM